MHSTQEPYLPMSAEPCKKIFDPVMSPLISSLQTQTGRAVLMTREAMVVAGLPYATENLCSNRSKSRDYMACEQR